MSAALEPYKNQLNLEKGARFQKIEHDEAMVADVYKVEVPKGSSFILKICERFNDYTSESYFLKHFAKQIPVPTVFETLAPSQENHGAILMEHLSGCLLTPELITKTMAFQLGQSLAMMHSNKAHGFGYLNRNEKLVTDPAFHFKEKFLEGIEECKDYLPYDLLEKFLNYFDKVSHFIKTVEGPCIVHEDFRPGNIIVKHGRLRGIVDGSSAKAGFAEDDLCSVEHGTWGNFNHCKTHFLKGYASVKKIPKYEPLMPLLRLSKSIGIVGFTLKRHTWRTTHSKLYQNHSNFLDNFLANFVN